MGIYTSNPKCQILHFTSNEVLLKCKGRHLWVKLYLFLVYLGNWVKLKKLGRIPYIFNTDKQSVIQSVKRHILRQTRPYSTVKAN